MQVPDTVYMSKLLESGPDLGQNTTLKATHIEQEVGVVLAVHGHKAALPLDGCDGARETILDIPEHSSTQIDVMLHESHPSIAWPALLVVVADNVLVVGVRMFSQVAVGGEGVSVQQLKGNTISRLL